MRRRVGTCHGAEVAQLSDALVLVGNLHEGLQGECRVRILGFHRRFVIIDEPEVIELPPGKLAVEAFDDVPGAVADPDRDDAEGVVGGVDDRFDRGRLLGHLAVGDDDQDVILLAVTHDIDRFSNDGSETGRSAEGDAPYHFVVPLQHLLEPHARAPIVAERKYGLCLRLRVSETENRNLIVLIERCERLSQDPDDFLVRIVDLVAHQLVQAVLVETLPSLPFVAGREVDSDDDVARLETGLPAGFTHLIEGREVLAERFELLVARLTGRTETENGEDAAC